MVGISRRDVLKKSAIGMGAVALFDLIPRRAWAAPNETSAAGRSTVYFTTDISINGLLQIYSRVNSGMTGRIGIKLHTGEPQGNNILPVELIRALQSAVPNSSILECNVIYGGTRTNTQTHLQTCAVNGFTFCPVDIMDADGDATLPVPGMREFLDSAASSYTRGDHLTEVAVGRNLLNYDSLLVYTHFKGHLMGGFGGSLKNIGIGCASARAGKRQVHGAGFPTGPIFLERMAESGKATTSHFGTHITYINVLKNLSFDCDCEGRGAPPRCPDIGILGSTDILAIDQASIDMVYAMPAAHRNDLVQRIESRSGLHQLEFMATLGMGNRQYDLVQLNAKDAPAITGGSVCDPWTYQPGVAGSAWISIFGRSLSNATLTWDGVDFSGGLPTSLAGVSVTMNGKPTPISFVSPGQANVLAPVDLGVGATRLTITTPNGASSVDLTATPNLPAFYAPFSSAGNFFVTAAAADGALVGNRSVDSRVRRGARPGEVVSLFGTGFGDAIGAPATASLFSGAYPLRVQPTITIGGAPVTAVAGYLVAPGLYQFNITVPDSPDGAQPIVAGFGTVGSSRSVMLTIQR
jgi:uncharacterized protein